ncbi:MAG: hypothetical protein WCO93_07735 [bacterium]
MRRFIKISVLILVYFLTCSKSCDNEEQFTAERNKNRVKAEQDSLRSVFETDTLPTASLFAFQEAAKQKFSDFRDYLNILADTTLAGPFRSQAGEMIQDLFISGEVSLLFRPVTQQGKREVKIYQMDNPGREILALIRGFTADSVWTECPLSWINDSTCTGRLGFTSQFALKEDKQPPSIRNGMLDILLIKRNKAFGNDTLKVWAVYLGNMQLR